MPGSHVSAFLDVCPVCGEPDVNISATWSEGYPRGLFSPGEPAGFHDVRCQFGCRLDPADPEVADALNLASQPDGWPDEDWAAVERGR